MPFAIKDVLQHKLNDRQIREVHEREYLKYISNLRQQSFHSDVSHLSHEHLREIERSRLRNIFNKNIQYERIQRENDLLSERLFKPNKQTMIDDKNNKYQQNLNIFNSKRFQQRANEYERINTENRLLIKRIDNVRGHLINKQQCNQDWQRHVNVMKTTCDYPENIDRFVSNRNTKQHRKTCEWNQRSSIIQFSSRRTKHPLAILLGLSE
jgi:hypothetical protein